jgi:hypothetical protein
MDPASTRCRSKDRTMDVLLVGLGIPDEGGEAGYLGEAKAGRAVTRSV